MFDNSDDMDANLGGYLYEDEFICISKNLLVQYF